jgi:hypothetical protein
MISLGGYYPTEEACAFLGLGGLGLVGGHAVLSSCRRTVGVYVVLSSCRRCRRRRGRRGKRVIVVHYNQGRPMFLSRTEP